MPLVSLQDIHLAYGHVALLDGADLSIAAGERVALIGRNGTGKSSLLRGIAGEIRFDDGQLVRQSGATLAWVPQEPQFEPGHTAFDAASPGLSQPGHRPACPSQQAPLLVQRPADRQPPCLPAAPPPQRKNARSSTSPSPTTPRHTQPPACIASVVAVHWRQSQKHAITLPTLEMSRAAPIHNADHMRNPRASRLSPANCGR